MFNLIQFLILYFVIIYLVIKFSRKFELYDIPNLRKLHKNKILNTSGLAFYIFCLILSLNFDLPSNLNKIIYMSSLVVLVGILDDIKNLSPSIKLICISLPTIYLITTGIDVTDLGIYENIGKISLGQFYFIFTLFAVGLLTNSYNYIDGIDGLIILTFIINITYLNFLLNDEIMKKFLFFVCLGLSINLILNFLPTKNNFKMFIGNGGSLFLGFFTSFLVIYIYKFYNIHPAYLIWSCWYPVYDFLYVTCERIIKKKTFYQADNNHFHHIIFKISNKSHFRTTILISLLNIVTIILAYQVCKIYGNLYSLVLFILLFFIFCAFRLFIKKKINKYSYK